MIQSSAAQSKPGPNPNVEELPDVEPLLAIEDKPKIKLELRNKKVHMTVYDHDWADVELRKELEKIYPKKSDAEIDALENNIVDEYNDTVVNNKIPKKHFTHEYKGSAIAMGVGFSAIFATISATLRFLYDSTPTTAQALSETLKASQQQVNNKWSFLNNVFDQMIFVFTGGKYEQLQSTIEFQYWIIGVLIVMLLASMSTNAFFITKHLRGAGLTKKGGQSILSDAGLTNESGFMRNSQNVYDKYKDETIEAMYVSKALISSASNKAIKMLDVTKIIPYDKLYHLKLVVQMSSGVKLRIEKATFVVIALNDPDGEIIDVFASDECVSCRDVPLPSKFTLEDLITKTQDRMGNTFFTYTAFEFNCQNFVINLLESEDLLTPKLKAFVLQDKLNATQIEKANPLMYHAANFATDLNNIIRGKLLGGKAQIRNKIKFTL